MIRGTDGYDYHDLGARLRGEKALTRRNSSFNSSAQHAKANWPGYEDVFIRSYRESYDHYEAQDYPDHICAASAHAQANFAAEYARSQDPANAKEFEHRQDRIAQRGGSNLFYTGVPPGAARPYFAASTTFRAAGGPAGDGGADLGQAPADPVHAAR